MFCFLGPIIMEDKPALFVEPELILFFYPVRRGVRVIVHGKKIELIIEKFSEDF